MNPKNQSLSGAPAVKSGWARSPWSGNLAASRHFAISDETFANLRRYCTEQEIVELCIHVAYCLGVGRVAAACRIIEERHLLPAFR
jgi:hypothetical protein